MDRLANRNHHLRRSPSHTGYRNPAIRIRERPPPAERRHVERHATRLPRVDGRQGCECESEKDQDCHERNCRPEAFQQQVSGDLAGQRVVPPSRADERHGGRPPHDAGHHDAACAEDPVKVGDLASLLRGRRRKAAAHDQRAHAKSQDQPQSTHQSASPSIASISSNPPVAVRRIATPPARMWDVSAPAARRLRCEDASQ